MIVDLFEAARADRANAYALDDLTYAELATAVARVAAELVRRGVGRGDRVALVSENRHALAFGYLAALQLGAIAVPVNPLYRADDLAVVFADAEPTVAIVAETCMPFVRAAWAHHGALLDAAEVERIAADARAPVAARRYVDSESAALIVYTSGTTGRAKGAMLSHRNLAAIATQLIAAWRWQADDTLVIALPLFHVHGLVAGLTASLCSGGRIRVHARFDAARVAADLAHDATMFFGVPTMYVRLLETPRDTPLAPLRLYVSGSAALSPEIHRAFEARFGAVILERYGATEFGFALGNRYAGPRVPGSVGIPFPGVRVCVSAREEFRVLDDGEIGELLVAGPNVFLGYWRNPTATAEAFRTGDDGTRWYRSGDLARRDPADDTYAIVGRIKELIVTGGFNVYPREVEDVLESLPGVRACAVLGKPDRVCGEVPVAFVEAEGPIDSAALLAALGARLASFKVPKELVVLDALPRNALGKLDKPQLRRDYLAGTPTPSPADRANA